MSGIKFTYENEDQSVKFWIDEVSGALCVEGKDDFIEIPADTGFEIVSILRQKQAVFQEKHHKKWNWFGENTWF